MKKNDGGTAFPWDEKNHDGSYYHTNPGMSLRDWFAGQALSGLLACPATGGDTDYFAKASYDYADAMLRGREK